MKTVIKIVLFFSVALTFVSCNSESAPDCFKNAGKISREEILVSDFTKITVNNNITLVLKDGPEQKVEVETGEFLRKEVSAVVKDGRLQLYNDNGCNFTRDYGLTTFYITAPNVSEIRSNTGLGIKSDGVLTYNSILLISENFNNPEADFTSGLFNLEIENSSIAIVSNGMAYYKLKGVTQSFSVVFASGDSRLSAENLIAQNISVNHRSSNDMLVNPQLAISGEIKSTGNVICYTKPATISVSELYKGRLIFK